MYHHQTLPDHFYYVLFLGCFLNFTLTSRFCMLMPMLAEQSFMERHTQRKRYMFATIGLITSGGFLIYLLAQYSTSQIKLGITEWGAYGGMMTFMSWIMWFSLALHIATIIAMPLYMIRFYKQPTYYAKYDIRNRRYVPVHEVRKGMSQLEMYNSILGEKV